MRKATYSSIRRLPDRLEAVATRPSDEMFFPFDRVPEQPPPVPQKKRRRSGAEAQRKRHTGKPAPCPHFRLRSSNDCQAILFRSAAMRKQMQEWRCGWEKCDLPTRRIALLRHIHACKRKTLASPTSAASRALVRGRGDSDRLYGTPVTRERIMWSFLGVPLCYRGFRWASGVNPWRAKRQANRGELEYKHAGFERSRLRYDEMYAAIRLTVDLMAHSSPFRSTDPNVIELPFHEKIYLFRTIEDAWRRQQALDADSTGSTIATGSSTAFSALAVTFSKKPKYRTFLDTLRQEFEELRFHRVVEIGRCPKCCFLRWKCLSASSPAEREAWQRLAAAHQSITLAQKKTYAVDRARAASDYPASELYMAFDGGSGYNFWLPHLAAKDVEGPSKMMDKVHTSPFKIQNGLIHGDTRSHVIISPPSAKATASHTCESILIAVNTAYEEHGNLPPKASVNLDNASVNHNMLVLGLMSMYVLLGVFDLARVRFEIENHAHDIYDAFQAIHSKAIDAATFFFLEEMIDIIKRSHLCSNRFRDARVPEAASSSTGSSASPRSTAASSSTGSSAPSKETIKAVAGNRPIMGPDVLVSNLWVIRDFWDWMFPGYHKNSKEATQRGAIVYYERLQHYRDFKLQREQSDPGEVKVGLWAKKFMSDPVEEYVYMGTVTTWKLYQNIIQNRRPKSQASTDKERRKERSNEVLDGLKKASKGMFKEQYETRLVDAIAVCEERWSHFDNSSGALPQHGRRQWLPAELAIDMSRKNLRRLGRSAVSMLTASTNPALLAELGQGWSESQVGQRPPPLRQRLHTLARIHGVQHGPDVAVAPAFGGAQPATIQELLQRPVAAGMYVVTRAAHSSRVGKASPKLRSLTYWVWKILRVYDPGAALPPNSMHWVAGHGASYEAHLHAPAKGRSWKNQCVRPVWDVQSEIQYLLTPAEKTAKRAASQGSAANTSQPSSGNAASSGSAANTSQPSSGSAASSGSAEKAKKIHVPLAAMLRPDNIVGGPFLLTSGQRMPQIVLRFLASDP